MVEAHDSLSFAARSSKPALRRIGELATNVVSVGCLESLITFMPGDAGVIRVTGIQKHVRPEQPFATYHFSAAISRLTESQGSSVWAMAQWFYDRVTKTGANEATVKEFIGVC